MRPGPLALLLALCFHLLPLRGAAVPAPGPGSGPDPGAAIHELSASVTGIALESGRPDSSLRLRAVVGRLSAGPVATPEGEFGRLDIPGHHATVQEGQPRLPLMNRLLWLPAGSRARVEARSLGGRRLALGELGLAGPLVPAQPSRRKSGDEPGGGGGGGAAADAAFAHDRAAYLAPRVARPLASAVPLGRIRQFELVRLEVAPVEYFPAEGAILVHEEIEIEVVLEGGDPVEQGRLAAALASPLFVGPGAGAAGLAGPAGPVHLAVVAPPEFVPLLGGFVRWKTECGYLVSVGTVGAAGVGRSADEIRAWLQGLYRDATSLAPAPTFVLVLGDVEQVPTFRDQPSGGPSDRPYASLDGDPLPDAYWGRLPARDGIELQAMLAKTLAWERWDLPGGAAAASAAGVAVAAVERPVLIAGVDSVWAPTHGNGQISYALSNYFDAAHGLTPSAWLHPESGRSGPEVLAALQAGTGFVNYTGHGDRNRWVMPRLTQSDVRTLGSGATPLVIANACETSRFDEPECFGETWLRVPGGGAAAYLGASSYTYWDEDYWWAVGATSRIVAEPAFATTGPGAFDGLFHDHGEPLERWFPSAGAIAFAGNLAVLEAGSSRADMYWSIYNLLGDPSLVPWLGRPAEPLVAHPAGLTAGAGSLTVEAAPGSLVGLTQDGERLGGGAIGGGGVLTLAFPRPLTPGRPLRLVVVAQDRRPYVADLPVASPATVLIEPGSLAVETITAVSVTVLEEDGLTPLAGVEVRAEGLGWASGPAATGPDGRAVLEVGSPYGPSCEIVGRRPGAPEALFRATLPVLAPAIAGADLDVEPAYGLLGAFALGLPGLLRASLEEPGGQLHAILPGGAHLTADGPVLELGPAALGQVRAILAVRGRDLYEETFPVVETFGTVQGRVACAGEPVAGARVSGLGPDGLPRFAVVTGQDGSYKTGPVLAGEHTLAVERFGYVTSRQELRLLPEANLRDAELEASPRGVLAGTIAAAGGAALSGWLEVRRADTGELIAGLATDRHGAFATPPLPWYAYRARFSARGHLPVTLALDLAAPTVQKLVLLAPARADVLVIDDGPAVESGGAKARGDGPAGAAKAGTTRSAPQVAADLLDLGFAADVVPAAAADPTSWAAYDLIVLAAGGSDRPLIDRGLREALISLVRLGRPLLVEGGDVGYVHAGGTFGRDVLHISRWLQDESGDLAILEPEHALASRPSPVAATVALAAAGYPDADAVVPAPEAVAVAGWSGLPGAAAVVAYDPNQEPGGGQVVFLAFNYAVAAPAGRRALLENSVLWLVAEEEGGCSVAGTVRLEGGVPAAGARVEAQPGGRTATVAGDGSFEIGGLFPGPIRLTACKDGWLPAELAISIAAGEQLRGQELTLGRAHRRVLLIDDAAGLTALPPKLDEAGGLVAPGAAATAGTGSLAEDLAALRCAVRVASPAGTDPAVWTLYDLVVISCGGNPAPLADPRLREAARAHAAAGRPLLVEGGEVGYAALRLPGFPQLAADVLRLSGWEQDDAGELVLAGDHPLLRVPNPLSGSLPLASAAYPDRDAVRPGPGAVGVGSWSGAPAASPLIAYDPDPSRDGGQLLYLACNYAALPPQGRRPLLENAVAWLTAGMGRGTLAGRVRVEGGTPAGVLVRADPGGYGCLADAEGRWLLAGLPAGRYTLRAALAGHGGPSRAVELPAGRLVAGIDFDLGLVRPSETCAAPRLAIPDGAPGGVESALEVTTAGWLAAVACEVEIEHPWRGDLVVELVSPAGDRVRLHDRGGGGETGLVAVYGQGTGAVEPAGPGSLVDLAGRDPRGVWRLSVVDAAGGDAGMLLRWCLRLQVAGQDFAGGPPGGPLLHPNYPNPFNPQTTVRFDLAREGPVTVRIYDAAGRLVRELLRGTLPAAAHALVWDGRDGRGRPAGAGIYLCRLETPDGVRTGKMALVK